MNDAPEPPPPKLTLRQWWWLPSLCVALYALMSLQPWFTGWMSFEDNFRFAVYRVAPWLVVAPLAVWLSVRWPMVGPRWKRAVTMHALAIVAALIVLDLPSGRMEPPRFKGKDFRFDRDAGDGPAGPAGPASAAGPARPEFRASDAPSRDADHFDEPPLRRDGEFSRTYRGPGGMGRGGPPWSMRLAQALPLYGCIVAAAHLLFLQVAARRAARIEAQLTETRLAALQLQLQPHFLFNSLNAISSLVRSNPDAADEMICSLGALLHAALDKSNQAEVTLQEEQQIVEHYLRIQRLRFGAALRIEIDVDPGVLTAAVPTFSLQPLLENSVIHGLNGRAGLIRLTARRQEDRLIIVIADRRDGPAAPSAPTRQPRTGVGLKNTRTRLATLYGTRAALTLDVAADGAIARLDLPYRELPLG